MCASTFVRLRPDTLPRGSLKGPLVVKSARTLRVVGRTIVGIFVGISIVRARNPAIQSMT